MNSREIQKSVIHGAPLMNIKKFGHWSLTLLCPENYVASVPKNIPYKNIILLIQEFDHLELFTQSFM